MGKANTSKNVKRSPSAVKARPYIVDIAPANNHDPIWPNTMDKPRIVGTKSCIPIRKNTGTAASVYIKWLELARTMSCNKSLWVYNKE